VFDIDETLIQYISGTYIDLWDQRKNSVDPNTYVESVNRNGVRDCIIFRPKLDKLMEKFKLDNFFIPALWTYSERDYCDLIANKIIEKYDLPHDFFLFKKGAEDIDEDVGIPKNLELVYNEYPEFNKFNTILVDDKYGNINNDSNMYNGLVIQPFAPFGMEKKRELLVEKEFKKQISDNVVVSIINVMDAIKKDLEGCDDEEYSQGFATEPVFDAKRIKRMGLDHFKQTFAVQFKEVISIGVPYLTNKFILIPAYDKYSKKMGGKGKSKKKKSMKQKRTKRHRKK
jgi:hypothetical protein